MTNNRSRGRAAILAGVAAATVVTAGPAAAAPLWPGGPDIPGAPAIVPGPPTPGPCSAAARGCLRLSDDTAWLMDNGKTVFGPTPISHGRPGYESHPGVFHVAFKDIYHWSTMHNAEMRYAVFFDGDIATHIGPIDEQSHGCIRMTPDGAREFFNYLQPGDIIEVLP
ncbi:L,D-transpeptidase [Nocardia stercoris]|uniref:Murein L,D-transpeptidase n=1 Tax=Nocardia stercoris TaxID=2483361 RepID=A0A3M2KWD6_9NOCA|nr:L,D-transpeptidase [Nocardia stercoris]RMI29799.1 murein L,D-transpeptidase [Nocardia stercoris]